MRVSEIFIKVIGLVLALVGLSLVLSAVGIQFIAVSFLSPLWAVVLGIILIGAGVWILRGGNITF